MNLRTKKLLVAVSVKNNGDWDKEYRFIKDEQKPTREEIEKFSTLADQAVTILDEDYPKQLKSYEKPPFVLFYKGGERSLLKKINTRNKIYEPIILIRDNGKDSQTKKIIDDILEHDGIIIILELNSGNIIIKDKTRSLAFSEYPDGAYDVKSKKQRSRVIRMGACLCDKLFVGIDEDTLVTDIFVNFTANLGKKVYVVPTSLGAAYKNNNLLRTGASIALEGSDVRLEWVDIKEGGEAE